MYWHKRLLPVAQEFKGRLQVVLSDEVEYAEELRELGLADHDNDIVVTLWAGKKEKYVMREDFEEDSLSSFIEVILVDGKVMTAIMLLFLALL